MENLQLLHDEAIRLRAAYEWERAGADYRVLEGHPRYVKETSLRYRLGNLVEKLPPRLRCIFGNHSVDFLGRFGWECVRCHKHLKGALTPAKEY